MNKPKFNPIVTRIKLNPEQAVLACGCWNTGRSTTRTSAQRVTAANYCLANADPRVTGCRRVSAGNVSIS